ncbi:hypothetical protein [Luedemannella helvata]|uniref:ESX-1 secretion-associated protein n=1 Tax=Luedemannella helvata TaxID=349315 RepID=A0ABP4WHG7_9ACTN
MADEVRANPEELAKLAGTTLDTSIALGDGWTDARTDLAVPVAAFGNLAASAGASSAHTTAVENADTAVGRLVAVFEGDVDRLYRCAFTYQQADQEAERKLREAEQRHPARERERPW